MALPEQIRKQSEEANRRQEEIAAAQRGTGDPPASEPQDPPPEPIQPELDLGIPQQPQAPANEPAGDEDDSYRSRYEAAQHRISTLQGITAAQGGEIKGLKSRINQLEALLASVPQQSGSAPQSAPAATYVTPKDVDEFGDSTIDLVRRVTKEETSGIAAQLAEIANRLTQFQTTVVPQVAQVASAQQITADQQFWIELERAVPNWSEINEQDGFKKWLLETDPLSDLTRQTLLENAHSNLDVRRVANFFNQWVHLQGGQPPQQAQPAPQRPTSELQAQVAPGRSKATVAPTPPQGKTYTQADIAQFYRDITAGKFKGRDEDRARIEADIFSAQREGRIR